jgi:hypothetical protein
MPVFTYRCDAGHTWDERRDRNDPGLDKSLAACETCVDENPMGYCGDPDCCSGGFGSDYEGKRVSPWALGQSAAVYFHGRGWSRVDKNYRSGE